MTVKIEEIVEEKVELPELPNRVEELPKKKPKGKAKLTRNGVLELVAGMKRLLDQNPGVIDAFVLSEVAGLPVLLVGPHGSGKTTMVKALYSSLTLGGKPLQWRYVNVKEGQTEYMVFARPHFGKLVQGLEEWVPLAVGCDAVFIDEVFRNTRIFAALNEALEEGTFEGLPVKWKFVTAATNPPNRYYRTVELLNYADLDRFAVIIEVEDRGLEFADKLAESFTPDTGIEVEASNLEKVREEIRSTRVSGKALLLAKLMVAAFSVCSFEPVSGGGRPPTIYNKFAVIEDLKCYRCVYQKHSICPKYALAPKRAIRSLIALAKARAWALGREVEEEDVAWAFRFTIPGRTAVISNELKEQLPTYGALYERMMDDFARWYDDNKAYLDPKAPSYANDPLLATARQMVKPVRRIAGYRVLLPPDKAARLMKWFIFAKHVSAERAAAMLQKLESGIAVSESGLTVYPDGKKLVVEAFTDRREAEELCGFLGS